MPFTDALKNEEEKRATSKASSEVTAQRLSLKMSIEVTLKTDSENLTSKMTP